MKKYNLLEDNIKPLFFRYLIPSISATLVTSIYILVDAIIIGKGIGANAVAALNIILPFFSLLFGTGLLFGVGGAVLVSFSHGKGDHEKAKTYFSISVLCAAAFSIAYIVIFSVFFTPITTFLGADDSTRDLVSEYGKVVVYGCPTFVFSSFMQTVVRNDKAPKLAMIGTIAGAAINIVLDVVFVYVFKWAMFGAAFASVLGAGISSLFLCVHFFTKNNTLKFTLKSAKFRDFTMIVKTGFSSFLVEMSAGIVIFVFNFQLLKYIGVVGVTAYSIISNTGIILMSMCNGVGQAAMPVLSTNYGAGKAHRVHQVTRLAIASSIIIGTVFTMAALVVPNLFINTFINPTKEISEIAVKAIRIYAPAFLATAVNISISNYFQGTIRPGYSMTITMLRGLVLNLLFIFVLPVILGADGIWMAIPIVEIITVVIALIMFVKTKTLPKNVE